MSLTPTPLRHGILLFMGLSMSVFSSQWHGINDQPEASAVLTASEASSQMRLDFQLPGYFSDDLLINGVAHTLITAPEMTPLLNAGAPDLPKFYRSVLIPDDRHMRLEVEVVAYEDITLKNLVPSKGNLSRDIDPVQVPFVKGREYQINSFYPQNIAQLSDPYVFREARGIVVQIHPFRYNPVSGVLRVYTRLHLSLVADGPAVTGLKNKATNHVDRGFLPVYENHFTNFDHNSVLYDLPVETGRMLVITPANFQDAIQPLVDWKRSRGLPVDVLSVSEIGNNATAIKNTVQQFYDAPAGLTFLLLIGDASDVAPAMSSGAASDPSYALLDGGNGDQYPDIFVGRFSGSALSQIQTQVAKVINYETAPDPEGDWYAKAIGLASAEGAGIGDDGESDIQHMNNIRTDLLGFGYMPVDQVYDPSANTSMVSNAVNEGRGLINYVGHGSNTAWSTTGFSNSNVNALNNTGKLPVIFSVACVNGNFQSTTCFAEAWLRAGSAEEPKGAVAFYGSTINQSWAPPMCAQDEFNDLLVVNANLSIGALMYAASAQMIDEYGSGGFEMYATWHIFGDPSMPIRTGLPVNFTNVSVPEILILGSSEITIGAGDMGYGLATLSKHGEILASVPLEPSGSTTLSFQPLTEIDTCLLTLTGQNGIPWQQEMLIIAPDGPYLITQGCLINDLDGGNGNGLADFGESLDLALNIYNVGADSSAQVHARISLDDPYLSVIQDSAASGCLYPDSTLQLGPFSLLVAEDAPDGHPVSINIDLDNGFETWSSSLTLTLHAPQLELVQVMVVDGANGRLDMGETANLGLCLSNLGGADLASATLHLETSDPYVEMLTGSMTMTDLVAGELDSCQFELATEYATPTGHLVEFTWTLVGSNNFQASGSFSLPVGLIIEDFESGDFDNFDWVFAGYQNWTIEPNEVYEGSYAARSGSIENNQNSEMSLTISMDDPSSVSFFYKVSSQPASDGLQFLVDGSLMAEWQGEIPWTFVSFDLAAGDHELVWKYLKNFSGSAGADCAWIDFITLPNMEIPGTIIGDVTADTHINVQDIVRLVNIILGQGAPAQDYELYCANVNGDDVVDIGDLVLLVNFIMGAQPGRNSEPGEVNALLVDNVLSMNGEKPLQALKMSFTGNFQVTLPPAYQMISSRENEVSTLIAYVMDGSQALVDLDLGTGSADFQLLSLQAANRSGAVQEITVADLVQPQEFRVYPNFPNPFNPSTSIAYDLPAAGLVKVQIFDIQGREIITLLDASQTAGHYEIPWNGFSSSGEVLSSGLYFAHFSTETHNAVLKMMLLK